MNRYITIMIHTGIICYTLQDELKPDLFEQFYFVISQQHATAKLQTQFTHLAIHLAQHHKGSH